MNTYGYHTTNIRPISSVYRPDQDVGINNTLDHTSEGIGIHFINALSSIEDVTTNNYNTLYLTEPRQVDNILNINVNKTQYPYFRTTYLKVKDADSFVVVQETTGTTAVTGVTGDINNAYMFELEFLNPLHVLVRHYDNNNDVLRFLTLNFTNSSNMTFTPRNSAYVDFDTQIFNYVLDETNDTISFFKNLSGRDRVHKSLTIRNDADRGTSLSALSGYVEGSQFLHSATPYTSGNTFSIRPITNSPSKLSLQSTWNSYISGVEENNLIVNEDTSIQDIKNSFLMSTATGNLSFSGRRINVDLMPLKDQVTIEGSISRNNPYSNSEDEVTHRKYRKLHTGTNQELGNESVHLTYNAGVIELTFPSDQLTYFHMPQIISPYTQVNINDTSLIKSGAIPADVPIKADKVFKKRTNNTGFNIPKDELNGTWLCSWLSGSPNINSVPVWVDRYYNPAFETTTTALTAGILSPVTYIDTFTGITKKLGASADKITVYDKRSDLMFEPGVLYAYHHVGRGNSQKVLDVYKKNLVASDLRIYKTHNLIERLPIEDISEPTHTMPDGSVMTGKTHRSDSIDVPKTYEFDNDSFGVTDTIKHRGSYTISFWMYADDWNKPFAHQFLGNYMTRGFGMYKEPHVTPFVAVPDGDKVHIYNTDYTYITSHLIGKTIKLFVKKGALENYWIMDSSNNVYEYDMSGNVQNKISSSLLTGNTYIDMDISDQYLYILQKPTSANASYFRYDLTDATANNIGETKTTNIWNFDTGSSTLSTYNIHSVSKGLSSTEGIVIVRQDALSASAGVASQPTTDTSIVSGTTVIGSGSVIDNNGNPWTIQNNKVYTYDVSVSSNIIGISATDIIDGLGCDRDGYIWVLHGLNKVSKFDSNRNWVFTSTLTGVTPVSSVHYNRYIDFTYDITADGYQGFATILNQSISGVRVVKLDSIGRVNSMTTVLTGIKTDGSSAATFFTTPMVSGGSWKSTTGFDYIRKHELNTTPRIEAKTSLVNIYNASTTTATYSAYTLSYGTSAMTRGWSHFAVILDTELGLYRMYINGALVDQKILPPGKFSHANIFDRPLTVGASPFDTKSLLSEHIKKTTHYLADGIKIRSLKIYDTPLNYHDIIAHYIVEKDTSDIKWDIPTGQRSYVDTIERIFKHRVPGRKSELFNINIVNSQLTDEALKSDIESAIKMSLADSIPIHTSLYKLGWDGTYMTLLTATTGTTTQLTADNIQQVRAPKSGTGNTITYGY